MSNAVGQRERVSITCRDGQTRADAALLIRHANGAIIYRIGIAIGWVKQIELLLGKIHPTILIKIFGVVFPDNGLELLLPCSNILMKRLCSRGKIIGRIIPLFVKINMYLW